MVGLKVLTLSGPQIGDYWGFHPLNFGGGSGQV